MQLYSIRFYNQLYLINFFLSIVVQCCTVCICMKAAFGELIPCNYGKKCAFGRLKCPPLNNTHPQNERVYLGEGTWLLWELKNYQKHGDRTVNISVQPKTKYFFLFLTLSAK